MDEESPVRHSSAYKTMWLLIVAVILILVPPFLYKGQPKSLYSLSGNLNESTGVKNVVTLPSKQPAAIQEESSLYANKKQAEHLFYPIIFHVANRYQIDPALVKAIIMAESGYDPKAISKSGAKGLMQLMPQTAEELGVKDCFNPEHNINGGVRYFKQLLNQFDGDIKLALAAYNAGGKNVRKYQGIPPFSATLYYIKKVFEYYQGYKKKMMGAVSRA